MSPTMLIHPSRRSVRNHIRSLICLDHVFFTGIGPVWASAQEIACHSNSKFLFKDIDFVIVRLFASNLLGQLLPPHLLWFEDIPLPFSSFSRPFHLNEYDRVVGVEIGLSRHSTSSSISSSKSSWLLKIAPKILWANSPFRAFSRLRVRSLVFRQAISIVIYKRIMIMYFESVRKVKR